MVVVAGGEKEDFETVISSTVAAVVCFEKQRDG